MESKADFFLAKSASISLVIAVLTCVIAIPAIVLQTSYTAGLDSVIEIVATLLLMLFVIKIVLSVPLFTPNPYEGHNDRRYCERRLVPDRRRELEEDESDRRRKERRKRK